MTMTDVADSEGDRSNGGEVVKWTDDDLGRVGGRKRRLGKRSRSSRSLSSTSDDNMPVEKRYPCLLAQACDGGAVLYGFNISDLNRCMNRRIFCRKYCAELSGGGEEPPVLGMRDLTPANSECNPDWSMAVAVGSSVYILGGDFELEDCMKNWKLVLSREVFKFDTNRPQEGWIQCPDMLNCRNGLGQAVAVEGRTKFRLLELWVSLRRGGIKVSVLSRETFVIDRPLDYQHWAFVLEGDVAWVKSGRICP